MRKLRYFKEDINEKFNNWVYKKRRSREAKKMLGNSNIFWIAMTPIFIIGGYCMVQELIIAIHNIGYLF